MESDFGHGIHSVRVLYSFEMNAKCQLTVLGICKSTYQFDWHDVNCHVRREKNSQKSALWAKEKKYNFFSLKMLKSYANFARILMKNSLTVLNTNATKVGTTATIRSCECRYGSNFEQQSSTPPESDERKRKIIEAEVKFQIVKSRRNLLIFLNCRWIVGMASWYGVRCSRSGHIQIRRLGTFNHTENTNGAKEILSILICEGRDKKQQQTGTSRKKSDEEGRMGKSCGRKTI